MSKNMKCPKCKTISLKEGKVKDSSVKIDYCGKCKGIWLDVGEFGQVTENAIRELTINPDADKRNVYCPRCIQPLHTFRYPQTYVKIDMCKKCSGLWLDAGELKEIEAVRRDLAKSGRIQEYDRVPGIKGALLNFVNSAIEKLTDFDSP